MERQCLSEHHECFGLGLTVGRHVGFEVSGGDPAVVLVDEFDPIGAVVACGTGHVIANYVGIPNKGSPYTSSLLFDIVRRRMLAASPLAIEILTSFESRNPPSPN